MAASAAAGAEGDTVNARLQAAVALANSLPQLPPRSVQQEVCQCASASASASACRDCRHRSFVRPRHVDQMSSTQVQLHGALQLSHMAHLGLARDLRRCMSGLILAQLS